MRDFCRYLLVLSVLGLGFYGASQHRVTDESPNTMDDLTELEMPSQPTQMVEQTQSAKSAEAIPLAALLDADRASPNDGQAEPVKDLARLPKITRQSTSDQNPSVDDSPAEQTDGAEKSTSGAEQIAAETPETPETLETLARDSETDQPRPSEPPRIGSTAATESSATPKFPLPKLAVRPGNRFSLPDPIEQDPSGERKTDQQIDPPWDEHEPDDPDSSEQLAADDDPSGPISLSQTQSETKSPKSEPSPEKLIHHVEQGDTLPKLAERYLGDREKYRVIFDANAQILPDPRLLPIGVELKIPTHAVKDETTEPARQPCDNDSQPDDPFDDLFAPSERSEPSSSHLEPIPPQALPKLPFDPERPLRY